MMKRVLSFLLCAAMVLTMVPAQAFAAEPAAETQPAETAVVETAAATTVPETTAPAETAETAPQTVSTESASADPAAAVTASGTCGVGQNWKNVTWELDDSGVFTISGTGYMEDFEATNYGYTVPWYAYWDDITSVVIEDGIVNIGDYAFCRCGNLTSVTIPNSVTDLGSRTFALCSKLTEISIPSSVTSLENGVFNNSGLVRVEIPYGVTSIDTVAFASCTSLVSVEVPASVTSIGDRAFEGCSSLSCIDIPASVSSIGENAFYGCKGLTDVVIPNGVTTLGNYAFSGCSSLKKITIPGSIGVLNNGTFDNCRALESVIIREGVTSIGEDPFYHCENLTQISLPESLISVGDRSFEYCYDLTDVYYAGTEEQWNLIDFADYTYNLTNAVIHYSSVPEEELVSGPCGENLTWTYENGTLTISGSGDMNEYNTVEEVPWHQYRAEITAVSLPEGLTSICYHAFISCTHLTAITLPSTLTTINGNAFSWTGLTGTVTIPASVTNIGSGAFQSCNALTAFVVDSANPQYRAIDGVLFSKDGTSLHTYPSGALATNYSAPVGTTTLEYGAFMGCHNLTSLSLPEGLTTIFSSFYCDNLTGILLPASLSYVGHYAFINVPVLSTVFYTGTQEQWQYLTENGVMDGNQSLLATMVHYNWERTDEPAPEAPLGGTCGNNLTWRLENGVLTISGTGPMEGYPWREYASQITAISIGQGVASISPSAFANLNGVTEVILPDSISIIGARAFQGLQGLTRVEIHGYAIVDTYAFNSCSQLKTLVLSKDSAGISANAFAYCSSLTDVYFTGTEVEWADFLSNKVQTGNEALRNAANVVCNYGAAVEPTEPTEPTQPSEPTEPEGTTIDQGSCGDAAAWTLDSNGHLRITGTGAVTGAPWYDTYHSQITKVTVAEGITSICEYAFADCTHLTRITMPASVTRIEVGAFLNCTAITSAGPMGSGADYEFGWTSSIPYGAFCYLRNLSTITWPEGLTSIGDSAFVLCGFTKLVIPEGVTEIGEKAFADCPSLKRLALPSTLTSVERYAFLNCMGLADVFVMGKKTAFGSDTFQSCSALTNVFYAVSEEKIGNISGNQVLQSAANTYYDWGNPMETSIQMNHQSLLWQWTDALENEIVICTTSLESASFAIIPGMNISSDPAQFALEQNGQFIQRNTTGLFLDICVKDYITPGKPIFGVIMNESGTVIFRKQLKVSAVEHYSITYVVWDKDDIDLSFDSYSDGTDIQEPPSPIRAGYVFEGWYTSKTYGGHDYFSIANMDSRNNQTGDITLYAKWSKYDPASLIPKIDTWYRIINTDNYFGTTHRMLPEDYDLLLKDPVTQKKYNGAGRAASEAKEWSGSCCGMSSFVVLAATGYLSINDFAEPDIDCIGDAYFNAKAPVGGIESAINYYHLRQVIGELDKIRQDYDLPYRSSTVSDSNNLKRIIEEMQEVQQPVVLNIELQKENTSGYFDANFDRHSVVAYNLKQINNTTYTFDVYDCSLVNPDHDPGIFAVTVNVVTDQELYVAECDEWEKRWTGYEDIFFGCTMTAEELLVNPYLPATGTPSTASSSSSASPLIIETQYDSFTLTNGNQTAVIKNGFVTSGDLPVQCNGSVNYVGGKERYQFEVPMTDANVEYEITHSETDSMRTSFFCDAPDNGFFSSVISSGAGTITIGSDGSVTTHFAKDTQQEISVTHNDMTTPWYIVDISGTSTGFSVVPSAETVSVISETETAVSIETKAGINAVTLENVPVSTEEVLIQENGNQECVVTQDNEVVAGNNFGYSVLFNSNLGTNVESLQNVSTGSLIPEPAAPTKAGYLFEGWFTDEDYTNPWDFASDTVTANLVLYAGWSVDPDYMKSVTFRIPGEQDQIVYLPVDSLISADYAPLGPDGEALSWFTDSACTDPWDFAADTLTRNLILYGQTPLCTVTFVTNTEQTLEAQQLRSGMTISQPALALEGFTLCGWYADDAFTEAWDFENDTVSGDVTLYARWLENEIDKNGQDTGICIEILNEDGITYTGKALKPAVIVRDNGVVLTQGKDYTVSYKNNTNACDHTDPTVKASKLPQIVIQGKGNYKSVKKITKHFTIAQADLKELQVTLPAFAAVKNGNKKQTLKATLSTGLVKAPVKAYILRYFTDEALTQEVPGITAAGVYYVVLEARDGGNYKGATNAFVVEAAPAAQLLSSARITTVRSITAATELPDTSAAVQALLSKVVLNKVTYLTEGEHIEAFLERFAVTATDTDGTEIAQADLGMVLMNVGKKTIHLSAKPGNPEGFAGTKDVSIQVKGAALSKKQFQVSFDSTGQTTLLKAEYTGAAQVPVVLSDLEAGTDYTVSYKQGKTIVTADQIRSAGSYTLVITGRGRYSGSLNYSFSITKVDLAKAYGAGRIRIVSTGTAVYDPTGSAPYVSLSYTGGSGRAAMENGTDYTLSYSGNKTVTEKAGITVKGKGNFSGSLNSAKAPELVYTITRKPLTASDISVAVTGMTLKNGAVKSVKFTVSHGTKKIAAAQYTGTVTDNGSTATLTVTAKDKLYTGSRTVELRKDLIMASDSKQVKISLPKDAKYYYSGSPIQPEVSITDAEGKDISGNFTVTYSANRNVGIASVTIAGRPEMGYCGTKTVKFTILPRWLQWLLG